MRQAHSADVTLKVNTETICQRQHCRLPYSNPNIPILVHNPTLAGSWFGAKIAQAIVPLENNALCIS